MKRWRADPLSEGEQGDIEAKLQQSFSRRIFLSAALVFAGFFGLFVRMGERTHCAPTVIFRSATASSVPVSAAFSRAVIRWRK